MMYLKDHYAQKAISQIPRLLGNQDRNPYSPTYGCFHRDYWLDKTSDFPDAVRQFGVHALALVYKYDFPGNLYKNHPKIRQWAVAAMTFWCKIQHKEGSFDEFYPYERGWVGPTAFTMYTMCESFMILKDDMTADEKKEIKKAIHRAAFFIAKGEAEEDHLANHHAMACLALWKAYRVLEDEQLKHAYEKAFDTFLSYHHEEEGWSTEYDGVDPGYLSATVSFLSKIWQDNHDNRLLKVIKESISFSSYFVYPNGFYGGSLGSRNTLHFYPHGYEVMAEKVPEARVVADKMLKGLSENKLVPPEIISDRYVFYRVPEYLMAYLDHQNNNETAAIQLPYEKIIHNHLFEKAGLYVHSDESVHILANLTKGGVIKIFDKKSGKLLHNNCGIIAKLSDGSVVSSQWVDNTYRYKVSEEGFEVNGYLNQVPSNKLFTPLKNIIFRTVMVLTGWHAGLAHYIKGRIRKTLILGQRHVAVHFSRRLVPGTPTTITDTLTIKGNISFSSLHIGDEFFVRYVPQSRYFQSQELEVSGYDLTADEIRQFNKTKSYQKTQTC